MLLPSRLATWFLLFSFGLAAIDPFLFPYIATPRHTLSPLSFSINRSFSWLVFDQMLRRRSVKSKSELQHRKSTSSTRGVHLEHIDAASAQRDAQAAACQAYTRALDRAAKEMPLFPPTPESSPGRHRVDWSEDGGIDVLRRRQSVRFVGSCSAQPRASQSEGAYAMRNSTDVDVDARPMHADNATDTSGGDREQTELHTGDQVPPPVLRPPPPIPLPGIAAGYLDALQAGEEYYTPEDDIASAPSSFRRLRRSKSLFTSEGRIRVDQDRPPTGTPGTPIESEASPAAKIRRMLRSDPQDESYMRATPQLRAPRSMSILRHRHVVISRTSRDGSGFSFEQDAVPFPEYRPLTAACSTPRLGPKRSGFLSSAGHRHLTHKSLRPGSSADYLGSPTPPPPLEKPEGFKSRARKVSKSFKKKLKSIFGLSRSEEQPPNIPAQHIDAQRTHVSDNFGSMLSPPDGVEGTSGWSSVHRVPVRVPSLHDIPANIIHSDRGSLCSVGSERKVSNDGSLTSWVHSGPSTLTSQQQQQWRNEWERQRLSIIRENGSHAPSRSLVGHPLWPQESEQEAAQSQARADAYADSQRIYSVLMKRAQAISDRTAQIIDQKEIEAAIHCEENGAPLSRLCSEDQPTDADMQSILDALETPTRRPRTTLTDNRSNLKRPERLGSGASANPNRYATYFEKLPFMQRKPSTEGSTEDFVLASTNDSHVSSSDPFTSYPRCEPLTAEDAETSDQKAAAFGSPASHLFRTSSPYRRALRKSMEEETDCRQDESEVGTSSQEGTQIHVTNLDDYDESVYSTDDVGEQCESRRPSQEANSTDIMSPATHRPAGYRADSHGSSVDWMSWLSANVGKMESPSPLKRAAGEYALPRTPGGFSGGHVRERAQTYDEDEYEKTPEAPVRQLALPILPLATVEPNVMKLSPQHHAGKHSASENWSPLPENNSPSCAPPIPPKSLLRQTPLKRPGHSASYSGLSLESSPGLTAAVQKQFGPVSRDRKVPEYGVRETHDWDDGERYVDGGSRVSSSDGRAFI
ncbi:hypothetical protein QBC47DRAFT_374907 [Echria macrotheca]|uniref:Uncharacterized protein n=1 Tax=Echria macrotheca TaxID=438768 RepID=A0AAJ0BHS2_9PEZI|nr:hypothetical protein QBC47DRAFT_374907 [Echria macrotheca]